MFGFLFGTACLLGLTATVARHHHHDRHGCRGRDGSGFRSRRARFVLHRVLDHLDTTPAQEKVIREAFDGLLDDLHEARSELRGTRPDVARAISGETLDRGALEGLFERHDVVIDRVRRNALDAFGKVHETLDERQRKILAELIESGPFRRGFGPFR